MSAAAAGRKAGITERTAQRLVETWRESGNDELPVRYETTGKRGQKSTLNEERTKFLIHYIDENPLAVVDETMEALCSQFEGRKISKTVLRDHIVDGCALSFKRIKKIVDKRNAEDTLDARKE